MSLRFFRRIRIAPGVSVNLSKSGASVSVGPKGAKVTVGPRGVRKTVGLPGTGIYYTTTTTPLHGALADSGHPAAQPAASAGPPPSRTGIGGFWARRSLKGKSAIVVLALLLVGALNPSSAATPSPTAANLPLVPGAAVLATSTPTATPTVSPSRTEGAAAALVAEIPAATPEATPKPTPRATPRPTPKATPGPAMKCHPSYIPCLPIVADLNCPAVRAMGKAPVRVIGRDVYHLDADHDGIGCE